MIGRSRCDPDLRKSCRKEMWHEDNTYSTYSRRCAVKGGESISAISRRFTESSVQGPAQRSEEMESFAERDTNSKEVAWEA